MRIGFSLALTAPSGSAMPALPAGFAFLVDENNAFLVDGDGAYLIAEVV